MHTNTELKRKHTTTHTLTYKKYLPESFKMLCNCAAIFNKNVKNGNEKKLKRRKIIIDVR